MMMQVICDWTGFLSKIYFRRSHYFLMRQQKNRQRNFLFFLSKKCIEMGSFFLKFFIISRTKNFENKN